MAVSTSGKGRRMTRAILRLFHGRMLTLCLQHPRALHPENTSTRSHPPSSVVNDGRAYLPHTPHCSDSRGRSLYPNSRPPPRIRQQCSRRSIRMTTRHGARPSPLPPRLLPLAPTYHQPTMLLPPSCPPPNSMVSRHFSLTPRAQVHVMAIMAKTMSSMSSSISHRRTFRTSPCGPFGTKLVVIAPSTSLRSVLYARSVFWAIYVD